MRSVLLGNGSTCCFASVHATQSGLGDCLSTLNPSTMSLSSNFCRPEYPTCPNRQCHVSQLMADSSFKNTWGIAMGFSDVKPSVFSVTDILYMFLLTFSPFATCF